MASSDLLPEIPNLLRVGDVEANRINSEAVNNKIGQSINYLLSRLEIIESWSFNGYFKDNGFSDGVDGVRRVRDDSTILEYYFSVKDSGTSGTNAYNVAVYDSAGVFQNNLFGSGANQLRISGSNGSNVLIGKDVVAATDFDTNIGGHTVQYGVLNSTTIDAGSILVPIIENNGTSARNAYFYLRLGGV